MTQNIVLVGAGSAQFGATLLGDIFQSRLLAGAHVVLHDINSKALKGVEALANDFLTANNLDFTLSATTDRRQALKGADFVTIAIEVGDRFKLWNLDRTIPQQYGLRQVFGENGGPGGLFHSLRVIPPIIDICSDVMDICPQAIVFNYSNPMSRICTTLLRKFPTLKLIGMCHEIAWLQRLLPGMLETPFDNLNIRAAGLNHFSCLLEASYRDSGADAYSDIRRKADATLQSFVGYSELLAHYAKTGEIIETETAGLHTQASGIDHVRPYSDRRLVREFFSRFYLLPITTDSHFGEYVGWAHDVADHRGILDFYHYYSNVLCRRPPRLELTIKERFVPIIEGILTNSGYEESAVNIANDGFIEALPAFMAVEVPAIVDSQGVHGVRVDIPKGFAGLLTNQIGVHDLTAEAILRQSRDLVIQALLVDPTIDRTTGIPAMVDQMIALQQPYLDYLVP